MLRHLYLISGSGGIKGSIATTISSVLILHSLYVKYGPRVSLNFIHPSDSAIAQINIEASNIICYVSSLLESSVGVSNKTVIGLHAAAQSTISPLCTFGTCISNTTSSEGHLTTFSD